MCMEPVVTVEGFKLLQNPEEARSLLIAYYETLGFHVAESPTASQNEKQAIEVKR